MIERGMVDDNKHNNSNELDAMWDTCWADLDVPRAVCSEPSNDPLLCVAVCLTPQLGMLGCVSCSSALLGCALCLAVCFALLLCLVVWRKPLLHMLWLCA